MPNKKNGKSSAEYYRDNKESYAKKLAKQKEINKKPSEVKKRVELTKINREKELMVMEMVKITTMLLKEW